MRIELPLIKKFQRPIVKLYGMDALIDTGAVIPMLTMSPVMAAKMFDAEPVLEGHSINGIGGEARGDVYRLGEFKVGDITYSPMEVFIPYEMSLKYPILLGAPLFYGMFYGFDTKNSQMVIDTGDTPLNRKFEIKELRGQLYPQIDGVLVQDAGLLLSSMPLGLWL